MIPRNPNILSHDELIVEKDVLCTQLEAGNPFLENQEMVLRKEQNSLIFDSSLSCQTEGKIDEEKSYVNELLLERIKAAKKRSDKFPTGIVALNKVALKNVK